MIERLYEAAARAGLLAEVEVDGRTVAVGFEGPAQDLLDGLVRSIEYRISYPASWLPGLTAGARLRIHGHDYQVRDVRPVGDGSERHADLARL